MKDRTCDSRGSSRRDFLRLGALGAASAALGVLGRPRAAGAAAGASRPNVILVLTDDQGYGDFSCHGNPVLKTPYLDRLHGQSVRLTDFHVAPMCTPTRSQTMTGCDALATGAYCVSSGRTFLRPGIPTMAEIFAAGGYRTAIFGKWHLGDNFPHRPMDRGFQEAVYHPGWGITSTPDYWNNDYFDDTFRHNGRPTRYSGYCTDVWFAEAARWIQACRRENQPFFAYLALNAPHGPFFVLPKYREPYKHLDRDVAGFFGMIANIDENMARLDAMLAESGLRDNTLLIFMTDNGGTGGISVYNAGLREAKTSLYEGGHRAACFIRWPAGRLRPPGDVGDLAECQDLLPTLIELCGLAKPQGARFDGAGLAPLLRGQDEPDLADRMLVVQYGGMVRSDPAQWDAAVMWRKWRLVRGKELYDVGADPGQQKDIAAGHGDVVQKMRDHYERWWAGVQAALAQHGRITIGSDKENPACLTSMDWFAPGLVPCSQPVDIRSGRPEDVKEGSLPMGRPAPMMNGPWNVLVDRDGDYEIALRRWPEEADAAIAAGLPPYQGADGTFPAGRALPIGKARLAIGDADQSMPVGPDDKAAAFTVKLKAGPAQLQTWFYDAAGKELCGAFYTYVRRK
jgi:arylsulfatase A-like enzyme